MWPGVCPSDTKYIDSLEHSRELLVLLPEARRWCSLIWQYHLHGHVRETRVPVGVTVRHRSLGVTRPGFTSLPHQRAKEKILISPVTRSLLLDRGSSLTCKMAVLILNLVEFGTMPATQHSYLLVSLLWLWWWLTPLSS